MYTILERFYTSDLCIREVNYKDFDDFKGCVIYVGKGCCNRKITRLKEAKKFLEGKNVCK